MAVVDVFERLMVLLILALPYFFAKESTDSVSPVFEINPQRKELFVFVGDSITAGGRNYRTFNGAHAMGKGFPGLMASHLLRRYNDSVNFINFGRAGFNSEQIFDYLQDTSSVFRDAAVHTNVIYVIILAGINDCWKAAANRGVVNASKFESHLTSITNLFGSLVNEVTEVNGHSKGDIILHTILVEPFVLHGSATHFAFDLFNRSVDQLQETVRRVGRQFGYPTVNFQDILYKELAVRNDGKDFWLFDGVHPTSVGHFLLAREILKQQFNESLSSVHTPKKLFHRHARVALTGDGVAKHCHCADKTHEIASIELGAGFFNLIAGEYLYKFPDHVSQFWNLGFHGNSAELVNARTIHEVDLHGISVLSIFMGSEEMTGTASYVGVKINFTEIETSFDSLFSSLVRHKPKVEVLLCLPFYFPTAATADFHFRDHNTSAIALRFERYWAIAAKYASKYHVPTLSFQQVLEDAISIQHYPRHLITLDGITPLPLANKLMAEAWLHAYAIAYSPK